jgi:hypothetical protein
MPYLFARQNPFDDARNTLSSWDNCMAKAYCKCVSLRHSTQIHTYTPQVASNSWNHRWLPHPFLGRSMHCAMHMLWRGMCSMLLQVLYLLLW